MPDCECINGCPFFHKKMKDTEGLGAIIKDRYCKEDNSQCARYMIFKTLGKSHVPVDLYPSQIEKAERIIKDQLQDSTK